MTLRASIIRLGFLELLTIELMSLSNEIKEKGSEAENGGGIIILSDIEIREIKPKPNILAELQIENIKYECSSFNRISDSEKQQHKLRQKFHNRIKRY